MVFTDGPYACPGQGGIRPDYDFMEVRENAGMVFYMPFMKMRNWQRGPLPYTAGPIFRYHPDPVREGQ